VNWKEAAGGLCYLFEQYYYNLTTNNQAHANLKNCTNQNY
jgi:hypothetical protein